MSGEGDRGRQGGAAGSKCCASCINTHGTRAYWNETRNSSAVHSSRQTAVPSQAAHTDCRTSLQMLPGQQLDGLLCAFSSTGTFFAIATSDGRLKSFDTVTGRLRTAIVTGSKQSLANGPSTSMGNGSLASGNQCLSWLDQHASAHDRSSNPAGPSGSCVAVGTTAGDVRAYDTATGELQWQCRDCNEGGVSCIAYSAQHSDTLLASGADSEVCQLDTSSGAVRSRFRGSKHPITGAAVSPDGSKLLLGSSILSLWDVASQKRICKFTGHPTYVRAIAFAPSGSHALSAAGGERSVAVWNTSSSKRSRKGGVAVAGLTMDDAAVQLHTCAAYDDGSEAGAFYAAAVSEAGEVYVWHCAPATETSVKGRLLARVRVGSQAALKGSAAGSAEVILAAHLEQGSRHGATLLVARGSSAKPIFERVQVPLDAAEAAAARGTGTPIISLEPMSGGALLPGGSDAAGTPSASKATAAASNRAAATAAAGATVLGADNAGAAVRHRVAALDAGNASTSAPAASKKRPEPEPEEPGLTPATPAAVDGMAAAGNGASDGALEDDIEDLGLKEGEQTLEARVAALEEQQEEQQRQQGAGAMDTDGGAAGPSAEQVAAAKATMDDRKVPVKAKADSLYVVLTQALRSGDKALLETCLQINNERVISNSVARLVPMDAAALLRVLVERLGSKPLRGQQLAAWVRAVLLHHTAYLMAAPGVQPVMTALYQTIEARLANHRALLSLSGRLDLLLSQMPRQTAARTAAQQDNDEEGAGAAGPRVVYVESDSEVEVEDPFAVQDADLDTDEGSEEGSDDGDGDDEDVDMDADEDSD